MRICHVISSLDPKLGGPQVVATRLAAAQAGLGHDLRLVYLDTPDRHDAIDAFVQQTRGLDSVPLFGLTGSIDRTLRTLVADRDVVHAHGTWDPFLLKATAAARRANVPYCLTPHGMLDPWCLRQSRLKKRIALMTLHGWMLNRAAFLHVLNADEGRLIKPLKLRPPSVVAPNGVTLEEIDPLPAAGAYRATRPELGDRPFFLFLSRLHYKKGLDILAEAYARAVGQGLGADLVVAGPDDGAQADFERRIADHGLTERAHVVGPIYGRTKLEAMVDALAFVLPSRQEGFSMAITEALACRTPVLITPDCHFPEVAEHDAGRVVTLDADAVARGMLDLVADPDAALKMGERGRALVETHYTWDRIAQRLIDAYQKAIAER